MYCIKPPGAPAVFLCIDHVPAVVHSKSAPTTNRLFIRYFHIVLKDFRNLEPKYERIPMACT